MVADSQPYPQDVAKRSLSYGVSFWVFVTSLLAYIFIAAQQVPVPFDAVVYLSPFVMIGVLALVGLWFSCSSQPFSLLVAHWTFILFFFSIAPAFQYMWDKFPPQADLGKFGEFHFHAAAVVIAWEIVVLLTYRTPPKSTERNVHVWHVIQPKPYALAFLGLVCFGIVVAVLGPTALLSRHDRFANFETISPAIVIVSTICRAIPFICAVLAAYNWRRASLAGKALTVLLILLAVMVNFPTGVARFWTGGIAVGLLCLFLAGKTRSALWLPIMFLMSFLVLMPILGSFRRVSATDLGTFELQAPELTEVALRGDFDNYIMLVNSAHYIANNEPTYGVTLVGNLLFFIPTSLWPSKPGNTRDLFIEGSKLEKINGNVANSLVAEGIMNFGWIGVVIYGFVFARLCRWLDRLYWGGSDPRTRMQATLVLFYPFLIGFVIYFLRGSFVPALSSSLGFAAGIFITVYFGTKRLRRTQPDQQEWAAAHV